MSQAIREAPSGAISQAMPDGSRRGRLVKRHDIVVRLTHWVNVLCLAMLLMSGLQISTLGLELHFGSKTNFDDPPFAIGSDTVDGQPRGFVRIGDRRFDTTGVLGLSDVGGAPTQRAFPSWITLPAEQDLGTGRRSTSFSRGRSSPTG